MDKNSIAVDVFNKRASLYERKYMNVDMYAETLDLLLGRLQQNACVLEIACGPGNITKYLLDKRPDLGITATDMAPAMLELAKANNPSIDTALMDCRKLGKLDQRYDCIVSGFVAPYLDKDELATLIKDARATLIPNGLLYITAMEGDYNSSGWQRSSTGDEIFVYYHEAGYITKALQEHGFTILHQKHQSYPPTGPSTATDLIILAMKNGM